MALNCACVGCFFAHVSRYLNIGWARRRNSKKPMTTAIMVINKLKSAVCQNLSCATGELSPLPKDLSEYHACTKSALRFWEKCCKRKMIGLALTGVGVGSAS